MTLPPELLKLDQELTKDNSEAMGRALAALERNNGRWWTAPIVLKNVQANDKTADFGDITFRDFNLVEAMEIQANQYHQKIQNSDISLAMGHPPPELTQDDIRGIFELWCTMIPKALDPRMGITKEKLMELQNTAWCRYVFAIIYEHSGLGSKVAEDLMVFFRDRPWKDTGRSVQSDAPVPERVDKAGSDRTRLGRTKRFLRLRRSKKIDV